MVLYENTFFQIISLFYVTLIGIVFIINKKIECAENHIFRNLVIVGFLSALMDIASIVCAFQIPGSTATILTAKAYLLTLIGFCILYMEYAIIVTNVDKTTEEKLVKYKRVRDIIFVLFLLIGVLIFVSPIEIYTEGTNIMYSYGLATTETYLVGALSIIFCMSLLFIRIRRMETRQVLPLLGAIILSGFAMIVQIVNPGILLLTSAMIFSIAIMYFSVFSVENSDQKSMKILEKERNYALRASEAKTDYLSNVSHELRTPLNAILGFSQGLLEEDLDPMVKEDVDNIMTASDTLLELVNEILDLSKIESNKLEIIEGDYGIQKVYKYLVMLTEGRIGDKKIQFIHEMNPNIPPVLIGDANRIKQIIINLLTNSIKYTKEGYVSLKMDFEKTDEENGVLVISVKDSGIGIKPEDLKKLFSKFSRLDTQKNNNIEGTGLGLALTKQLVDLMHGDIQVESKYNEGSTFTVRLYQKISHKKLEEVEKTVGESKQFHFKGHGERILIVDDNHVNLKVANRLMKNYNLKIDYATSGPECIEKVHEYKKYDLIMIDDQMPDITGIAVMKQLKQEPNFHTPMVVLTANALSGMKEQYLKVGFDGYLSKPLDKILLEELLIDFFGKEEPPEEPKEDIEFLETTQELHLRESKKGNRAFLEENGFDIEKALETLIDMKIYTDTAGDIVDDSSEKIELLKTYLDNNNMNNYSVIAHAVKGDAKYMGMTKLAELSDILEKESRAGNIDFIRRNHRNYIEEMEKNINILKEFLGR